jgi:hypothetical protein
VTWVNTVSIPANSKITIYLGFASKSTNLLSNSGTSGIGEAPQLSPSYAEYDDGANVFNNYWNFAGTTLPAGWTTWGTSPVYTVNNGLQAGGNNGGVETSATFNSMSSVIDYFGGFSPTLGATDRQFIGLLPTSFGQFTETGYTNIQYGGTVMGAFINPQSANTNYLVSLYYLNGKYYGIHGYNINTLSYTDTFTNNQQLSFSSYSNTYFSTAQWVRVRAMPPNGVMPSVSFGSEQSYLPLTMQKVINEAGGSVTISSIVYALSGYNMSAYMLVEPNEYYKFNFTNAIFIGQYVPAQNSSTYLISAQSITIPQYSATAQILFAVGIIISVLLLLLVFRIIKFNVGIIGGLTGFAIGMIGALLIIYALQFTSVIQVPQRTINAFNSILTVNPQTLTTTVLASQKMFAILGYSFTFMDFVIGFIYIFLSTLVYQNNRNRKKYR